MAKYLRFLKTVTLTIITALIAAELLMRAINYITPKIYPGSQTAGGLQQKTIQAFVASKIDLLWQRGLIDRKTMYEPPFQVFVNRGFDDKKRLSEIATRSVFPPNTTQTQQNFLQELLQDPLRLFYKF